MTDTEVDVETQARQLVARGREVLVERTRTAYGDAAAAQADLITLDDARIETMVQAAADRADGLQWRRALATVAADEFGISPSEALSHPAVTRAQSLVGAPSYEQSLAELIARPVPPSAPVHTPPSAPVHTPPSAPYAEDPSDELETVEADDVVLELLPEPDPAEYAYEPEPEPEPEPALSAPESAPEPEPEPEPALSAPEPHPVEYETQAYDVEASFTEAAMPPAPANPFAETAPVPAPEPYAAAEPYAAPAPEPYAAPEPYPVPEPEHAASDEYLPPTEEHHSAGVAAALAAVSVPGSVPDPVQPDADADADTDTDTDTDADTDTDTAEHHEPEPAVEDENIEVSFTAVHLGGVAGLPTKREGLSVRLSADGLDIMQGPREIIGRLVWDEIEALEVPNVRVRRRQKGVRARLVVRTPHGDASFEVPDVETDELRDRVEPLMRLYGRH